MAIPGSTESLGSPTGASDVPSAAESDWTDQVTDLIVDSVDKVRARTTGPVLNVAHAAVYGVVALIILLPVTVILIAGLVRLLNWAIPGDVWIAYAIISVVSWIAGWLLWRLRSSRADT